MRLRRQPQRIGVFRAGDPHSGYYSDLTREVFRLGQAAEDVNAALAEMIRCRRATNPVTVVQAGLGAWQLMAIGEEWRDVVECAVDWVVNTVSDAGLLAYAFPMPHTYRLAAPWYSAMAQAEAASLLVRAARTLRAPELEDAAHFVGQSLLDRSCGLIADTEEGPVLQEYPTSPPAHVLNGWITSLWGLYDLMHIRRHADGPAAAFLAGVDTLVARLPRYRFGRHWSRYDLFPHPLPNVASPFYHCMHIEQLAALDVLEPRASFRVVSDEWRRGLCSRASVGSALAAKVAFRVTRPRAGLRRPSWRKVGTS
jgi:hypothetical protein